jgi:hypothetical protein
VFGRILVTLTDPSGRRVVLDERGWKHITEEHPELSAHQAAIGRAVEESTFRHPGRRRNEEWFYFEGGGPSQFLKVVVRYSAGQGRIVTAFPRRAVP